MRRFDDEGNDCINSAVTDYWLAHFVGRNGRCKVCENSGMFFCLDNPIECCFCPNGQIRRQSLNRKEEN